MREAQTNTHGTRNEKTRTTLGVSIVFLFSFSFRRRKMLKKKKQVRARLAFAADGVGASAAPALEPVVTRRVTVVAMDDWLRFHVVCGLRHQRARPPGRGWLRRFSTRERHENNDEAGGKGSVRMSVAPRPTSSYQPKRPRSVASTPRFRIEGGYFFSRSGHQVLVVNRRCPPMNQSKK